MEKLSATYELDSIKEEFSEIEYLRMTKSALNGAIALGIDSEEVVEVIQTMQRSMLTKSMTSNDDVKIWHDVYRVPHTDDYGDFEIYVKFTVGRDGKYLLISFKEYEN